MSYDIAGRLKNLLPGNIDDLRGPYASVALANAAIPNTMVNGVSYRLGKIVDIGAPGYEFEHRWIGGFADNNLVKVVDYETIFRKSNKADIINTSPNLFDKTKVDRTKIIANSVAAVPGAEVNNIDTTYCLYRFGCDANSSITVKNFTGTSLSCRTGMYAADGSLLLLIENTTPYTFVTPPGTATVKIFFIGYAITQSDQVQISLTSDAGTFYPYVKPSYKNTLLADFNQTTQGKLSLISNKQSVDVSPRATLRQLAVASKYSSAVSVPGAGFNYYNFLSTAFIMSNKVVDAVGVSLLNGMQTNGVFNAFTGDFNIAIYVNKLIVDRVKVPVAIVNAKQARNDTSPLKVNLSRSLYLFAGDRLSVAWQSDNSEALSFKYSSHAVDNTTELNRNTWTTQIGDIRVIDTEPDYTTFSTGFSVNFEMYQNHVAESRLKLGAFGSTVGAVKSEYDFKSLFPVDLTKQYIGTKAVETQTGEGLSIVASGFDVNNCIFFPTKVNSREYKSEAIFKIVNNAVVSVGMNGGNQLDFFLYADGGANNGKLILYKGGTTNIAESTPMTVVNGNTVKITLRHFYDRMIGSVENLSVANQQTSCTYFYDFSAPQANLFFQPIDSAPRISFLTGTSILKSWHFILGDYIRPIKTVVNGDSLSSGFFVNGYANMYQTLAWAGKLKNMVTVSGPGYNMQQIISYAREVISYNPVFVLIWGGTNDYLQSRTVEQFKSDLETLTAIYLNAGIVPVLMTTVYINGAIRTAYNEAIIEVAGDLNIKVIRIDQVITLADISTDNVHILPSGAVKIANKIKTDAPELL